jgi:hypothetical protein
MRVMEWEIKSIVLTYSYVSFKPIQYQEYSIKRLLCRPLIKTCLPKLMMQ